MFRSEGCAPALLPLDPEARVMEGLLPWALPNLPLRWPWPGPGPLLSGPEWLRKQLQAFSAGSFPALALPPSPPQLRLAAPHEEPRRPPAAKRPPPAAPAPRKARRPVRRSFTESTTSPVSGTIIRQVPQKLDQLDTCKVVKGDIDGSLNCVEATPEARAELAKIENRLGDYLCRLCRHKFEDAFQLAQHRCPCIVHIEYRCLQCDKVFHCPANLASHQRWHKPKRTAEADKEAGPTKRRPREESKKVSEDSDSEIIVDDCSSPEATTVRLSPKSHGPSSAFSVAALLGMPLP